MRGDELGGEIAEPSSPCHLGVLAWRPSGSPASGRTSRICIRKHLVFPVSVSCFPQLHLEPS